MNNKNILQAVLLLTVFSSLCALDYSAVQNPIGNAFSSLVDKNEGLTGFRSLYIPSGGRSEALGSAFTALANDIGFFEYNPAASSTLENTELALFHNAWIGDSAIESIAFSQRQKDFGYGAALKCFYVPFTEYNIFGERTSSGYYTETFLTLNASYNFFSGYEFKGLAVGLNLKTGFRGVPDYANKETGTVIKDSGLSQSALALMADVGIQMRFNFFKNFSSRTPNMYVGFAVQNIGAAITGFGKTILLNEPLPTRAAFGLAFRPMSPLTFTFEFQQPINLMEIAKSEQWAVATGIMIQFTDFFAFSAGLLMRGANPRFSIGAEALVMNVHLNVNYTLDLTTSFNPLNKISLGLKINLGDRGRRNVQQKIDALYSQGLQYYSEGELDKAIEMWQKILLIDSGFDPAKWGINAALGIKRLQQRIRQIQVLD